eukprot:SAG11_NODE_8806_length_974_cov_1.730286_1_plen_120_part_00
MPASNGTVTNGAVDSCSGTGDPCHCPHECARAAARRVAALLERPRLPEDVQTALDAEVRAAFRPAEGSARRRRSALMPAQASALPPAVLAQLALAVALAQAGQGRSQQILTVHHDPAGP